MRVLGLVVFGVGGALVAFGFSFSRILIRELGPPKCYADDNHWRCDDACRRVPSSICYGYWVFDACGESVKAIT
jgi:hypothetical protein